MRHCLALAAVAVATTQVNAKNEKVPTSFASQSRGYGALNSLSSNVGLLGLQGPQLGTS